jgi:hypothetical protein
MEKEDPATLQIIVRAGNIQTRLSQFIAKIPHGLSQDDAFVKRKGRGKKLNLGEESLQYASFRICFERFW